MGRGARKRQPRLPPVERIELNEKHTKLRWIAAIFFLVIGAATLAYGFSQLMSPETGWVEIESNTSLEESCAGDFVFLYNLGASGVSARAENKAVTALYSQAAQTAYQLFHSSKEFDGVNNVCTVNLHPNQELQVDEALYRAFSLLEQYNDRTVYLAPVYETYDGLFSCSEDSQTEDYDPYVNDQLRDYHAEAAAFAADPAAVRLELLGENRVRLTVSGPYLRWAEANGTTSFIDFYWMKNAFIADYLARTLTEYGYTLGTISSYDGYVRALDESSGTVYGLNLYDRVEQTVYPAAVMQYTGTLSIVSLRDHPLSEQDAYRFYTRADGQIRTPYLDVQDGLCKSAVHDLVFYSRQPGCAEVLLQMIPYYIAEELETQTLPALSGRGIEAVYFKDSVILHTDPQLSLTNLFNDSDAAYTAALAK